MRRYLLAHLLISIFIPAQANETCMFISQYEPDLKIEVGTKGTSETKGYIKYKGSPVFRFSTGIRNGYGGQYFSIDTFSKSMNEKEENIVSGSVITIIGDQSGTGTPRDKRKPGLKKIFLPNFGLNYWYSLQQDEKKLDGQFDGRSKKIHSIFSAAEGFWIPSEICKKYFPSDW